MAEVKKVAATAKKAVKKAEPVKAAVKEEVKKVEAETKAAVKATAKKATVKTAETKEAVKATAKKATAKTAETKAAVKATAKKAVAKKVETKATLNVQFAGKDYTEAELIKMAKDAYKKAGNKDALKTINVYANVDDQIAYYVANGNINGQFAI